MSANAERGSGMTVERAIALYGGLSKWLTDRIGEGEVCSCGHCHLCAYNFLKGQAEEIARLTERCENLRADYDNDLGHLKALKEGSRQLRELFAKYGIDKDLNWPEWIAAVSRLTERCDAYREALKEIAERSNYDDDDYRYQLQDAIDSAREIAEAALASPAGEHKDKTT